MIKADIYDYFPLARLFYEHSLLYLFKQYQVIFIIGVPYTRFLNSKYLEKANRNGIVSTLDSSFLFSLGYDIKRNIFTLTIIRLYG